jgi:hypothetical protein
MPFWNCQLQAYINMMQERDDLAANDKDVVTPKILDGRVEQSVRFQFVNPLVGMFPRSMSMPTGASIVNRRGLFVSCVFQVNTATSTCSRPSRATKWPKRSC